MRETSDAAKTLSGRGAAFAALLGLSLVILSPLPAEASDFWLTGGTRTFYQFIDAASIRTTVTGKQQAWEEIVLTKEEAIKSKHRYEMVLQQFDCADSTLEIVSYVFYTENGDVAKNSTVQFPSFEPVVPGSVGDAALRFACATPDARASLGTKIEVAPLAYVQGLNPSTDDLADFGVRLPEATVPKAFRGEWNSKLAACGTSRNDTRLVIGRRQLEFYESVGEINSVRQSGPSDLFVELKMSYAEGGSGLAKFHFKLLKHGSMLKDMSGQGLVRQRCLHRPATKAQ